MSCMSILGSIYDDLLKFALEVFNGIMMSLGCLYAVQLQFFSSMGQSLIDT